MALYRVVLQQGAYSTVDGDNAMIVRADDATAAKAAAQAHTEDDAAPWELATATAITVVDGDAALVVATYREAI